MEAHDKNTADGSVGRAVGHMERARASVAGGVVVIGSLNEGGQEKPERKEFRGHDKKKH